MPFVFLNTFIYPSISFVSDFLHTFFSVCPIRQLQQNNPPSLPLLPPKITLDHSNFIRALSILVWRYRCWMLTPLSLYVYGFSLSSQNYVCYLWLSPYRILCLQIISACNRGKQLCMAKKVWFLAICLFACSYNFPFDIFAFLTREILLLH